jgi:ABC-type cobalamin/Fe3+-siderophores transport system ATPase subunit
VVWMGQVPVEVRGVVKRYGEIRAVDDVDLTVEVGDIYGYLGPNGAGKTTTLRMLLGLIHRDGGSVSLFGRDPARGVGALEGVSLQGAGPDQLLALTCVAGGHQPGSSRANRDGLASRYPPINGRGPF